MLRELNIVMGLRRELLSASDRLSEIQTEMLELQSTYDRYRQLVDDAEQVKDHIRETAAVIGPSEFHLEVVDDFAEKDTGLMLSVPDLRKKLPLWRAMVRLVKYAPWIQIVELHMLLREVGIMVSRAAIESALSVHKNVFRIKRKGREKFVALRN